jgi:hypothetical protein
MCVHYLYEAHFPNWEAAFLPGNVSERSVLTRVGTAPESTQAPSQLVSSVLFMRAKRPEHEADHLAPTLLLCITEVKNTWSFTSIFIGWCLFKTTSKIIIYIYKSETGWLAD